MNLQAYADHRKARGLRGSTHVAVLNAIKDGRLTAPAVRRDGRNWIIDAVAADQQWAARTDPAAIGNTPAATFEGQNEEHSRPQKGLPALSTSKAIKAAYDAKMSQIEYQKAAGELGNIQEMQREAATLGRSLRDSVLAVPDRVAGRVAAMNDQHAIRELISGELKTALRALREALA